jgi:hypothetical protein
LAFVLGWWLNDMYQFVQGVQQDALERGDYPKDIENKAINIEVGKNLMFFFINSKAILNIS